MEITLDPDISKDVQLIVLAAGRSSRFEKDHKLGHVLRTQKILNHVLNEVVGLTDTAPLVICNQETAHFVAEEFKNKINLILNQNLDRGMLYSIQLGIGATDDRCKGFMIALADMPYLTKSDYKLVLESFCKKSFELVTFPEVDGVRGHPVCFPMSYKPKVLEMPPNDSGLRRLIEENLDLTQTIKSSNNNYLRDIDTLSDIIR